MTSSSVLPWQEEHDDVTSSSALPWRMLRCLVHAPFGAAPLQRRCMGGSGDMTMMACVTSAVQIWTGVRKGEVPTARPDCMKALDRCAEVLPTQQHMRTLDTHVDGW